MRVARQVFCGVLICRRKAHLIDIQFAKLVLIVHKLVRMVELDLKVYFGSFEKRLHDYIRGWLS